MCMPLNQNTLIKQTRDYDFTPDFYSPISTTALNYDINLLLRRKVS